MFFETDEALVSADADTFSDIYERAGGQTTLVSTGPNGGNGDLDPNFRGASDDGTRVFFETNGSLVSADADTSPDVYERAGGQTMLVSTGPDGGNDDFGAFHQGNSADGTRVFFDTEESLVGADGDETWDVYERTAGGTTLVSTGPDSGNSGDYVFHAGNSDDGTRVFIATAEPLVSTDDDTAGGPV